MHKEAYKVGETFYYHLGKEVMFSVVLVRLFLCLSVCLSASNITKKLQTDCDEILGRGLWW